MPENVANAISNFYSSLFVFQREFNILLAGWEDHGEDGLVMFSVS